ncbi:MAG: glycosyltransferase [Chitinophagaceae bacterium]|nr:glycosyltransferase [Chitinophagaceae bacterium]
MKVVLIFRSRLLNYHSIENVFGTIQNDLSANGEIEYVCVDKVGFRLSNIFALRKLVRSGREDTIYHVTGDIHYAVFALPRKRTVLTIHDCVFINKRKGVRGWILKKLYLDWPVKYVQRVTAISQKTKQEVISLTGCNPDKIKVISNPVSYYISYTQRPFNRSKPVLLFIGSLPNKNLNRVIEALKNFSCTLNIIGSVDSSQQQKMDNLGIDYRIERNLSNEEMATRYQQSDVILFPSLYEGFGLPVIEGFKAGRAVLTSEISPLKELSDGAAWLVDPYNIDSIRETLTRIVNDDDTRNKKIQAGFTVVDQYTPHIVASSYWRTYNDLHLRKLAILASVMQYFF